LEDQRLESDFGLRVALNSIPPDKVIEIRAIVIKNDGSITHIGLALSYWLSD